MQLTIQVKIDDGGGNAITEGVFSLENCASDEGLIGLSLSESKRILKQLQNTIVGQQANRYTQVHRCCPSCHKKQRVKDSYDIQYRTLFGIVPIPNRRLFHCQCTKWSTKTYSVLNGFLPEHNSPELQYIETKWASLMSYGMTVDLLTDVLPVNECLNAETVRRHVHKTAKRQDDRLEDQPRFISGCQYEWANLPKPDKPITVGIDGGYVRDCENKKTNFEVIVATSFSKTQAPQRRMMKLLRDQGIVLV